MELRLPYGSGFRDYQVPDDALVLRRTQSPPAGLDAEGMRAAVLHALRNPVEHEPLAKLCSPNSTVVIAFDDCSVPTPPMASPDFREIAIPTILGELNAAGVSLERVRLICANALHRQWTRGEMSSILGQAITTMWPASRLFCHDAEDPQHLVYLGETPRGFEVEVSRYLLEADLFIYVNLTPTPMNGGWKSTVVGLSTFRSIRHHHRPFPMAGGHSIMDPKKSAFHKLLGEMGAVLQAELDRRGKRIFQVEAVLDGAIPPRVTAVFAGHPPAAHAHTLAALAEHQVVPVEAPVDALIIGLPDGDPYSRFARVNPLLLTNLGMSYTFGLYQNFPVVRPGGILILLTPFAERFDDRHHPSYREFYERILGESLDPVWAWDEHVEEFAHRPSYLHKYRYGFGFHPTHPFFMWNSTLFPRRHLSGILVVSEEGSAAVPTLGFEPVPDLHCALIEVENRLGQGARVAVNPLESLIIPRVQHAARPI